MHRFNCELVHVTQVLCPKASSLSPFFSLLSFFLKMAIRFVGGGDTPVFGLGF